MTPLFAFALIMVISFAGFALIGEWRANVRYERAAEQRIANVRRQIDALPKVTDADWNVKR